MVEFTSERPRERMAAILNGMGSGNANPVSCDLDVKYLLSAMQVLSYANSPFIQEAGLAISNTPSLIDGQLLPAPEMVYAPGGGVVVCAVHLSLARFSTSAFQSPRDGGWNVVNQRFHRPQSVSTWAVVDYSLNRGRARTNTETFITMLVDCCKKLGMNGSGTLNVHEDLHRAGKEASSRVPPDLILVVLPASAAEIRLAVKQFGDVLHGISTQCVREDKIARCNNQYCNNVAMKINAKLGGINAVPRDDSLTLLKKRPFMIMGADVGHPAPGVRDQPSVASLVFSFEPLGMCYEAICSIQPPRLEVIEELGNMVKRAVTMFGRKNQISPHSIIFFRDGLSEGLPDDSKAAINTLWEELRMKDPQPLLTYIVVGKKFFPTSPQDSDKSGNCKAGFVAAEGIGNPMAKDFYLQSHGGLLGTSRPSHYIVLKDETFNGNLKVYIAETVLFLVPCLCQSNPFCVNPCTCILC
ncbi:hypothetical protein ID866_4531 [Astraeus odoratus]|nr:hypothetical protein ID866_4531 [Astraeus odoratus]